METFTTIFDGTFNILIPKFIIIFEETFDAIFINAFVNVFGVIAAILCTLFIERFGNILAYAFDNMFVEKFDGVFKQLLKYFNNDICICKYIYRNICKYLIFFVFTIFFFLHYL
ncbi:MAG: hypothetical protein GY755_07495 [Chloroflexi bacterium]|nr:hypothetical protein [Chloroflexota bacterium]